MSQHDWSRVTPEQWASYAGEKSAGRPMRAAKLWDDILSAARLPTAADVETLLVGFCVGNVPSPAHQPSLAHMRRVQQLSQDIREAREREAK